MTKNILRVSALLTAIVLTVMIFAAVPSTPTALAAADTKPVFTISTDREAAPTGSQVVVSVAVDNDTTNTITSFLGELRFDTRFFRYSGFEDQISMDGSVSVVSDSSANGKLSFVYTGKELTNTRINSGDNVVFIKFIFSVATNYDTTGQFFIGTINDCYYDDTNIGIIDCKAPSITVRSTTAAVQTPSTTAPVAQLSGDARLASLTVEGGTLSPNFNSEFVAYTVQVPYEKNSVRIDAVTSASGAIASGLGIKDLVVGVNNFTVTVLAENGTMREYGLIIIRLEPTQPSESTTPTSATTALPETSTTEPTSTTTPQISAPTDGYGSTTIDVNEGENASDDVLQVVGIVFGEIALFFFGFLSGFFVDKNLRRKGERRDDDDDYDDGYDYDEEDNGPTIYTPENMYNNNTYMDPGYQQPYMEQPPLVDPQLVQYSQFLPPITPDPSGQAFMGTDGQTFGTFQQGAQVPPAEAPQATQFGEQPIFAPVDEYDQTNFGGPYYS